MGALALAGIDPEMTAATFILSLPDALPLPPLFDEEPETVMSRVVVSVWPAEFLTVNSTVYVPGFV